MEPADIDEALDGAEELRTVLDDLEARSRSFGSALTAALKGAVLDGDSLVEVLQNIAYRFSSISLDVGLKPLETSVASTRSRARWPFRMAACRGGCRPSPRAGSCRSRPILRCLTEPG